MRAVAACASLALSLAATGCRTPGKPGPRYEVVRPDQVLDFPTLYTQNCQACHGNADNAGPAITLANPVYLAVAGEANIVDVLNHGRPGGLMPAFGQVGGGLLTEEQVNVLAKGLIQAWGQPGVLDGVHAPQYKATLAGNAAEGQKVFGTYCASCHGPSGNGEGDGDVHGPIVDPVFLTLISDQNLRSIVISGMNPEMPSFKDHEHQAPLTDQNVTDIVAWLISHRAPLSPAADKAPDSKAPNLHAPQAAHEPTSYKQELNR